MTDDFSKFKYNLGQRIKTLRKERDITQAQLGELIGKDFQAISRIENGKINPSAYIIYQIAAALKVSAKDLLDF